MFHFVFRLAIRWEEYQCRYSLVRYDSCLLRFQVIRIDGMRVEEALHREMLNFIRSKSHITLSVRSKFALQFSITQFAKHILNSIIRIGGGLVPFYEWVCITFSFLLATPVTQLNFTDAPITPYHGNRLRPIASIIRPYQHLLHGVLPK